MKAKEFIEKYYQKENSEKSLLKIVYHLFIEIQTIGEQRHAQTNASFAAIVKEQNKKWHAILNKTGFKPNSWFIDFVLDKIPELASLL